MNYRKDIDGLRAIAVIPIVLFHASIPYFDGGFVGVDIFFVISGYLITCLLLRDIDDNSFKFNDFWLRRIRRILPASFIAILVTLVAFSFVAPPINFKSFGGSLFSGALFSSNIFFWKNTGYFAGKSELEPLLHTWSLSVEEQFYFFFPCMLVVLSKYLKHWRLHILSLLAIISFALSVWGTARMPSAAFYLLPFRAWELAIGGILAFLTTYHIDRLKRPLLDNFLSLSGFLAILYSIFLFNKETPFPSYSAALPCFGTALIIWANRSRQTIIGVFLSTPILVFIGKISYSLYLYHWIFIVFNKYIHLKHPSILAQFLVIVLSFVVSYASFRFIENPFRYNKKRFSSKFLVYFLIISSVFYLGVGGYIHFTDGVPNRFGKKFIDYSKSAVIFNEAPLCSSNQDNIICHVRGMSDGAGKKVFLWGDSHAKAILPAFIKAGKKKEWNLATSIIDSCPPITNLFVSNKTLVKNQGCQNRNQMTLNYLSKNNYDHVVLVSRWNIFLNERDAYDFLSSPSRYVYSKQYPLRTERQEGAIKAMRSELIKTISKIKSNGAKVHIVLQVPIMDIHPADNAIKQQIFGEKVGYSRSRESIDLRSKAFLEVIKDIDVSVIDLSSYFCNLTACSPYGDKISYYFDDDHLSIKGAELCYEAFMF